MAKGDRKAMSEVELWLCLLRDLDELKRRPSGAAARRCIAIMGFDRPAQAATFEIEHILPRKSSATAWQKDFDA